MEISFGTDGLRGRVGSAPITTEHFLRIGQALGRYLGTGSHVIIGRDTRLSGHPLSLALSAGLLSQGLTVSDLAVIPTPAVAFHTRKSHAAAGLVITASHNPYSDNGLKIFDSQGLKLSPEAEAEIVTLFGKSHPMHQNMGDYQLVSAAQADYLSYLISTLDTPLDLSNVRIVGDFANGAGHEVGPHLFEQLGATLICLGTDPDGLNINSDCGATHLDGLQRAVVEHHAHIGIALDGDGDRLMMVDHEGTVVDGDESLWILVQDRLQQKTLNGGVVGTVMSNWGQEKSLKQAGVPYERASVGDANVMALLQEKNWWYGAEPSGHVICREYATTGDGLLTALHILAAMKRQNASLAALSSSMARCPQTLTNIAFRGDAKAFLALPVIQARMAEVQDELGEGRLLIRPSGTEPLIRIMIEAPDQSLVDKLSTQLRDGFTEEIHRLAETGKLVDYSVGNSS